MSTQAASIAAFLRTKLPEGTSPKLMIICGSGLGGLADTIDDPIAIKYGDIEGFPGTLVVGHKGELVFGKLSGCDVMCMNGRFHSYEGHDMQTCTLPVRVGAHLGIETLIVTNAAGGLNRGFKVGDLMVMSDHLFIPGMAGRNPLVGHNDPGPDGSWPRFPPMSDAYDPELAELAWACGAAEGLLGFMHPKGTYAMVSGPNYETAAECRYLHGAGADAVGMSTAPECIVARHCGMKVLGFSLITNVAVLHPGDGPPANHAEVIEATQLRAAQLQGLVRRIVGALPQKAAVLADARGKGGCLPAAARTPAPGAGADLLPHIALFASAVALIIAFRSNSH
jgi:purine-nucleoside phosphorylase